MKRIPIFLLMIVLVNVGFFISCKKESDTSHSATQGLTLKNQKILEMIHHFKLILKSELKDGETLSIDSTVWYIEATMNETYARADSLKNVIFIDSAFIDVPINQDQTINISDADSAYDECVHNLSDFYYSFSGDPGILFVDVSLAKLYSNHIKLKEIMVICKPGTNYVWFGTTDNWYWGNAFGKCDGTQIGRDATTELSQHANWSIPYPGPGAFFINLYTTPFIYPLDNPLPPGINNPYGYWDTYLFGDSGPIPDYTKECLIYDAMNYYLSNLISLADIYKPQDLFITNYFCHYDYGDDTDIWAHVHYAQFTYGLWVISSEPPIEPPPNP